MKILKNKNLLLVVLISLMIVSAVLLLLFSNNKKENNNLNDKALKSDKQAWMGLDVESGVKVGEEFLVNVNFDTYQSNVVLVASEINYECPQIEFMRVGKESDLSIDIIEDIKENKIYIVRGEPGDAQDDDNDDGVTGKGKLIDLIFKAKTIGACQLNFNSEKSKIILDDGKGMEMDVWFEDLILNIQ